MQIHARWISLGGVVLLGIASVFGASTYLAFIGLGVHKWIGMSLMLFTTALLLYACDAWSETLSLSDDTLFFHSWFRHARRIPFTTIVSVSLVHEGLNSERGAESLIFQRFSGGDLRLTIGPLWRHRDLASLMRALEYRIGSNSLEES